MSKMLIEKQVKTRVKGEARKKVQTPCKINKDGEEILDENPLFLDAGFKPPETMNEKIRRITLQVQQETAAKFAAQNMTDEEVARILDEEDDFDLPDEYGSILTQYEARGLVTELEENVTLETSTPAKQSGSAATEGEALAKPADAPIPPEGEAL